MLGHVLHKAFTRHQKAAGEIGVQHRLPALGTNRCQRGDVLTTRVIDQCINSAMLPKNLGHQSLDACLVSNITAVAADACGIHALLRQLLLHSAQFVRIATHQRHRGAQSRQLMSHAATDA